MGSVAITHGSHASVACAVQAEQRRLHRFLPALIDGYLSFLLQFVLLSFVPPFFFFLKSCTFFFLIISEDTLWRLMGGNYMM